MNAGDMMLHHQMKLKFSSLRKWSTSSLFKRNWKCQYKHSSCHQGGKWMQGIWCCIIKWNWSFHLSENDQRLAFSTSEHPEIGDLEACSSKIELQLVEGKIDVLAFYLVCVSILAHGIWQETLVPCGFFNDTRRVIKIRSSNHFVIATQKSLLMFVVSVLKEINRGLKWPTENTFNLTL